MTQRENMLTMKGFTGVKKVSTFYRKIKYIDNIFLAQYKLARPSIIKCKQ